MKQFLSWIFIRYSNKHFIWDEKNEQKKFVEDSVLVSSIFL